MDKKIKRKKIYRQIKQTVLCGILALIIQTTTLMLVFLLSHILCKLGILNMDNYKAIAFFDFAAVCIFIGCTISVVVFHYPVAIFQKLMEAMEQIANGDYSARFDIKKPKIIKNIADKFNNMAQQLGSTEKLSSDFINNFSHEFKTPIASINGFAKILKNNNLSDKERNECLDVIIQESARLSNLSTNILNLSKIEQQSILTNKERIDISEHLRLVIGALYPKWSKKNIEFIFNVEEFYITGNKEMLEQVWINLIDNAIKFSPEGGKINIAINTVADKIECTIENNGKPIPEESTEYIFNKFYKADKSHSTSGNGLGLPLVKKIAKLHNGDVYLKKSDEDGTVFAVSLPKQ